jgi:glycerophosphoryl diester phosphodiesterase
MVIVAHRGESFEAPENTLAAFRLAWERGLRTAELDIHMSSDCRLMVCHDPDALRTTGVSALIAETPCAELQRLDAGRWKGDRWAGERIPTLDEVLDALPQACGLWIEIKCGAEAAEPLAALLRRRSIAPDRATMISFREDALRAVRSLAPEYGTHLLSAFSREERTGSLTPTLDDLISRAQSLGVQALNVHWSGPIAAGTVRHVHDAGLRLCVWTVDDLEVARRMAAAGVDGITSNRASWLRDALASSR